MPNSKRTLQIATDNRKLISSSNDLEKEDEEQGEPNTLFPPLTDDEASHHPIAPFTCHHLQADCTRAVPCPPLWASSAD
jgi:hypothetical protein